MNRVVHFVHLSVSMCTCGSVPLHPPLVAIQLLTTEGKVKVLQTKRQNVLTRASSDKRSEECGLRQGCRESRYTTNSLAQMNRLGLLTNTPLFYFFPFYLSFPWFFFSPLSFSEGYLPLKQWELIFPSFLFPPFFYLIPFCHRLPPHSPNQYSICMYTGIKYKCTHYKSVTAGVGHS